MSRKIIKVKNKKQKTLSGIFDVGNGSNKELLKY
jgi:hypothetical protein